MVRQAGARSVAIARNGSAAQRSGDSGAMEEQHTLSTFAPTDGGDEVAPARARPVVPPPSEDARLRGKVAVVTGGSRGIGAAIALRLAVEGAKVAVTYPHPDDGPEELIAAAESAGYQCRAVEADNADPAAVRAAIRTVAQTAGRIDILVNNAGIIRRVPVDSLELADFDLLFAVNVRGAFVASQEAAKYMNDGGRIIMIGSCVADRMPFAGGTAYAMSKAALAGMVRGLARDLAPSGIMVNTIQPGPTDTDLNPATGSEAPAQRLMLAVGRFGRADEVANLVAFPASDEAAFITGASLNIYGGFNS